VNKKDTDVSSFKQQQMNQQKQFLDECNKKVFDMQVECQKKDIEIKELTSLNQTSTYNWKHRNENQNKNH
jgi:hypothetical protein